ncbi:hypothetical protein CHUAL_010005 [Chamberlinius hualienensis]
MDELTIDTSGTRRRRSRRSTRGYLSIDGEDELCEFISKNEPDDKRLEMLIQMSTKHALDTALKNIDGMTDNVDKSSATSALLSVVDDLRNDASFKQAVGPEKNKGLENVVDVELENNIKVAENYLSILKTESEEWDYQLERYENETVAVKRKVENVSTAVTEVPSDNMKYQERLNKIQAFYAQLVNQSEMIGTAAKAINDFQTNVEQIISDDRKRFDDMSKDLKSVEIFEIIDQMECQSEPQA